MLGCRSRFHGALSERHFVHTARLVVEPTHQDLEQTLESIDCMYLYTIKRHTRWKGYFCRQQVACKGAQGFVYIGGSNFHFRGFQPICFKACTQICDAMQLGVALQKVARNCKNSACRFGVVRRRFVYAIMFEVSAKHLKIIRFQWVGTFSAISAKVFHLDQTLTKNIHQGRQWTHLYRG